MRSRDRAAGCCVRKWILVQLSVAPQIHLSVPLLLPVVMLATTTADLEEVLVATP